MSKLIPRLLLTNDDGFDAPGLAALINVATQLSDDVWVVAPQLDQSGVGQNVTLNNPIRCVERGMHRYAISGTPADCVVMALSHLMRDARPDLILSGINAGANIGDDVNVSGTLGAAFTGLMLGVRSMGISLDCLSRKKLRWDMARAVLPKLITDLVGEGWEDQYCLSVNLPDLPSEQIKGVTKTRPAMHTVPSFHVEKREDLREKEYFWLYPGHADDTHPDTDCAALSRGEISVSGLTLARGFATE
jgi:5'-nucleotidase